MRKMAKKKTPMVMPAIWPLERFRGWGRAEMGETVEELVEEEEMGREEREREEERDVGSWVDEAGSEEVVVVPSRTVVLPPSTDVLPSLTTVVPPTTDVLPPGKRVVAADETDGEVEPVERIEPLAIEAEEAVPLCATLEGDAVGVVRAVLEPRKRVRPSTSCQGVSPTKVLT